MPKSILLQLVLAMMALIVVAAVVRKLSARRSVGKITARRRPLSQREQAMFFRLRDALPDQFVLAQVAMSALLSAKSRADRNTFDRKVIDFVVCSRAFEVLAVVELDDASHKSKSNADAARDSMLLGAGFRVLRYANVPDEADVRRDVQVAIPAPPASALSPRAAAVQRLP
jgi:very-short-patch-repair endonuclease